MGREVSLHSEKQAGVMKTRRALVCAPAWPLTSLSLSFPERRPQKWLGIRCGICIPRCAGSTLEFPEGGDQV